SRLLQDQDDPVQMTFDAAKTKVLFRLKDVELVAQLIQGTFPNYNQLIPAQFNTRVVVDVDEFRREARIAAIFARDGSGIIRLMMTPGEAGMPGQLMISARADEVGGNEGQLDARVEGDASKIAFNSRYLQEVLNVLGSGRVALEMTSPSAQGVFRPVDENGTPEPGYVHVVMPMFVQW
ncbi:MAG: DNA polymerase III subunit beta, partial [Chloroflexota bacterium]